MLAYARMMFGRNVVGAGGALDTQTVTTGAKGTAHFNNRESGYERGSIGTIADGTSNIYAGALIQNIAWIEDNSGSGNGIVELVIAGTLANSGWTTMTIDGSVALSRAAAAFGASGGFTTWEWPQPAGGNPFGAPGSIHTVVFT